MIIKEIKFNDIGVKPIFYSRWHSVSTSERGLHYDLSINELVSDIIKVNTGLYIVVTFLTDISLSKNILSEYERVGAYKIWNNEINTIILEDETGILYSGTYESFSDDNKSVIVNGSYCVFTDNSDDAYIESFFKIKEILINKINDNKDYTNLIEFVNNLTPIIKDIYPEKFI